MVALNFLVAALLNLREYAFESSDACSTCARRCATDFGQNINKMAAQLQESSQKVEKRK